jgi:acetylglutamate kinase
VLEAVTQVLPGGLQSTLLAALRRLGLPAVGLSGVSAGLVEAVRRGSAVELVDGAEQRLDFGEVGDIVAADPAVLRLLCGGGYLPVVAPLGCSAAGALLNINADTVASALAVALGAAKLVFLLQPPGVLADSADSASLLSELSAAQLAGLAADGTLSGGMLPKAAAAQAALAGGVGRVHFVSGINPDALLAELSTNEGSGTLVVPDA